MTRAIKHGKVLTFVVTNDKERKEVNKLLIDLESFKIPKDLHYPITVFLNTAKLSQANA